MNVPQWKHFNSNPRCELVHLFCEAYIRYVDSEQSIGLSNKKINTKMTDFAPARCLYILVYSFGIDDYHSRVFVKSCSSHSFLFVIGKLNLHFGIALRWRQWLSTHISWRRCSLGNSSIPHRICQVNPSISTFPFLGCFAFSSTWAGLKWVLVPTKWYFLDKHLVLDSIVQCMLRTVYDALATYVQECQFEYVPVHASCINQASHSLSD